KRRDGDHEPDIPNRWQWFQLFTAAPHPGKAARHAEGDVRAELNAESRELRLAQAKAEQPLDPTQRGGSVGGSASEARTGRNALFERDVKTGCGHVAGEQA